MYGDVIVGAHHQVIASPAHAPHARRMGCMAGE
jgi:hypothetical protein